MAYSINGLCEAVVSLETDRLIIKTLFDISNENLNKYSGWLNDDDVNSFLEARFMKHSINTCAEYIHDCHVSSSELLLGIHLKEDNNAYVGNIKVGMANFNHNRCDIGIVIGDKTSWGKGLAKEACSSVINYLFNELQMCRVEAGCYEENLKSINLFLNLGFVVDGYKRGHYISNDKSRKGSYLLSILK